MFAVWVLLMAGLVSSDIICPDGKACQDKNTCCPAETGYECCQYPKAVCCADKAHCCPEGYVCDQEAKMCVRAGLPWYRISLSRQKSAQESKEESLSSYKVCDKNYSCPDGTTCCKIPFGTQSCCPYSRTSVKKQEEESLSPPNESSSLSASYVRCDNYHTCPDGTTCCKSPYGTWTCCPYSMGQCCRDGLHCCPHGYYCDSTSTRCLQGDMSQPSSDTPAKLNFLAQISVEKLEKESFSPSKESSSLSASYVRCDSYYTCPDGTTCCKSPRGTWTCCPYSMGQCCHDGLHCCPHGYYCDSTSTHCLQGDMSQPSVHIPALLISTIQESAEELKEKSLMPLKESVNVSASYVRCDSYHTCPDGTTCCKSPRGTWTCCPYSMGQCCRDGLHCCPHGYYCDSSSTHCLQGDMSEPSSDIPAELNFLAQISVKKSKEESLHPPKESSSLSASYVRCDSYYTCPDGTTCCKSPYGTWTCCSYSMGQCCRDGLHCCPHGYYCDSTSTHCLHGDMSQPSSDTPAKLNFPAESTSLSVSYVRCDNYHTCPDGTTCCKSPYGTWTCCPYSMGQCCRDGLHCCPHGYYCDSTSTRCLQGDMSQLSSDIPAKLNFFAQISVDKPEEDSLSPSKESSSLSASYVRCDSYYTCPDGTTCCKSPYGKWTCCPYSMGQCCRDGLHCCPHGYYCDSTSTHCLHRDMSQPSSYIPALLNSPPKDQCCLSKTGCCPVGFHCDEKSRACVMDFEVPAALLFPEQDSDNQIESGVIRCSGRFYCPAGNTCCRIPTGQWGCCPFPLGQCCKDGIHCCKYQFNCDHTYSKCTKDFISIPAHVPEKPMIL